MTKDVRKLNYLRNKFMHFVPTGFALEVSGMPRIVGHCSDAIEHLAVSHPTFWHHLDDTQAERIKTALSNVRKAMDVYRAKYKLV